MEVPKFQRAAVVMAYGGPAAFKDNLKFVTDKPVPQLQPGQVLVRMRARPVHPADGYAAMGVYPGFAPASALPATLGLEGMGEVASLGTGVTDFKVGQRVVPLFLLGHCERGEGSWQEYVAVGAEHLVPLPDSIPDEIGAQAVGNPVTVFAILQELSIPQGEYLLQTQAGGAVGRQMISLAKAKGIRTINVVRRREVMDELKALGADEVICSTSEDVTARVMEITGGKGAYGALDSVGGELTGQVIAATRAGGTVVLFGRASGPTLTAGIKDFIFRGVTLKGFWVQPFLTSIRDAQKRRALFEEVFALIESGGLDVSFGKTRDLSEFALALGEQQEVGRKGKIILTG